MEIIPAILAEKFEDCLKMLKQAESFTHYVQIDVMDGVFVPSRSFPVEELNHIHTRLSFEIHLMVKDPLSLMTRISNPQLKKVLFHFESDIDHFDFIKRMKERGMATGLAIKPETPIVKLGALSEQVDTLLFLTVNPGYYGGSFLPQVLKKIEEARSLFPDRIISADGGISLDNLEVLLNIGVDYGCIGSRIFRGDPEKNYQRLSHRLLELEAVKTK
jgi:ribulose-phosphate 3-epimerase